MSCLVADHPQSHSSWLDEAWDEPITWPSFERQRLSMLARCRFLMAQWDQLLSEGESKGDSNG